MFMVKFVSLSFFFFFFLVICITLNIVDWDQFFKDFCSVLLSMVYKYSWL